MTNPVNNAISPLSRCVGEVSLSLLAPLLVSVLLLAWCGASLWQLVVTLDADIPQPVLNTPQSTALTPVSRPPINIDALAAIPLFGEVAVVETIVEPEVKKEEPLEETKLNLILKGLFTSDDNAVGRAIIANGRNEQLYQVGDAIEGLSNVSLSAVLSDSVRLKNQGKNEVLYLYPEGERVRSVQQNIDSPTLGDVAEEEALQGLPSDNAELAKFSDIIRVVRERNKETGDMIGFRVLPGRNREAFEQSGLLANDVITSIDGEKLNDLRTAMGVYRNKRNASQVSLMISRDGSELSVDIDLNTLQ